MLIHSCGSTDSLIDCSQTTSQYINTSKIIRLGIIQTGNYQVEGIHGWEIHLEMYILACSIKELHSYMNA